MTDDTPTEPTDETPDDSAAPEGTEDTDEAISLDAARKLRSEAKTLRDRAKTAEATADNLARRLHLALVEADGRLVNATELPYRPEHLEDPQTLTVAIDALLEDRPYLKARKLSGDIGQGRHGETVAPKDFSALFR